MDGNPGGSAPLAMTCSARIAMCALSKYENWPVPTFTAPTLKTNIIGFVNAIEVDQSLEGALESGRIVVADAFVRREPIVQLPGNEKSGLTKRQGHQYAGVPLHAGQRPFESGRPEAGMAGYLVPEGA